jgi:hypothetical protein
MPLLAQLFLSLISVCYFAIVVAWLLPSNDLKDRLLEPIRPFFYFFHLDQRWAFYAPYDRKTNFHFAGELTFDDGTAMILEPPRRDKLTSLQSFKEQKTIVLYSYFLGEDFKYPDCAQFLERPFENSSNPPKYLSLNKFWCDIPEPGSKSIYSREHPPPHSNMSHLFTYELKKASEK